MNSVCQQEATDVAPQQFSLLRQRRFLPLFCAQFGGAFNDNFYKSSLLILFTYGGIERWGLEINVVNNIVSAALIVPFLLFAAMAGQYADKYEKSRIIRGIKVAEIAIMMAGALALWLNTPAGLLLVLFFTGTQSACFSPLKYSIIPQHVAPRELVGANGLMHMGTSFAIFLGLIAGSLAIQLPQGRMVVALGGLAVAVAGWWVSRQIPLAPAANSQLQLYRQPWRQTLRTIECARENKVVLWAIVGISWYWFLGSIYLTQLPNFSRSVLSGGPMAVTVLLCLFLVGVSTGALLCEKLSAHKVEPGIVPLGMLGLALCGLDLFFVGSSLVDAPAPESLRSLSALAVMPQAWRVAADILLLGVSGGIYIVPLASLMQSRSRAEHRAQVVAANNIINAVFMLAAALLGLLCLGVLQLSIPELFLIVTCMNLMLAGIMFMAVPEFWRRFVCLFSQKAFCWFR